MRKKDHVIRAANVLLRPLGFRLDYSHTKRHKLPPPLNPSAKLAAMADTLSTPLSVAVLGSLDETFDIPRNLHEYVRLYSLDAVSPGKSESGSGHVVPIQRIVAPKSGHAVFIERQIAGVSSLLAPNHGLIERYGLQWMYAERTRHEGTAIDLRDLRIEHKLPNWDVIRTDLEGADLAVLRSLGSDLAETSVVEMELRTEPFYVDEPYMHDAVQYMSTMGFEVLDLKPERWRAKTKHMLHETRGRLTFCNTVFVNRSMEEREPNRVLRHAFAVGLYGYPNFAERIWENYSTTHSKAVTELESLFFGSATAKYEPFPGMGHVTHSASD